MANYDEFNRNLKFLEQQADQIDRRLAKTQQLMESINREFRKIATITQRTALKVETGSNYPGMNVYERAGRKLELLWKGHYRR